VNFLSRFIRIIFSAILLGVIFSLLRRAVSSRLSVSRRRASPAPDPARLFRDPSCGTFVSPEISLRLERAGQVHHFCSEQCRDRFLKQAAAAASGLDNEAASEQGDTRHAAGK
jgi:YHS domain-containing protein